MKTKQEQLLDINFKIENINKKILSCMLISFTSPEINFNNNKKLKHYKNKVQEYRQQKDNLELQLKEINQ